jgi:hypothetical protein
LFLLATLDLDREWLPLGPFEHHDPGLFLHARVGKEDPGRNTSPCGDLREDQAGFLYCQRTASGQAEKANPQ